MTLAVDFEHRQHTQTQRTAGCSPEAQEQREGRDVEHLLYVSHFLSTWNSRLFEFGAFLFLASIYPSTLLPASIYALARAAAAAVLSPWIGPWIDQRNRLSVIRLSIAGQRIPTLLSCLVFLTVLSSPAARPTSIGFVFSIAALAFLACLEKLSIVMNTISVERDWVVVIAGDDEASLSRLNARMRRIDLFCKLIAPLTVSFLDAYSTMVAVIATGAIAVSSCAIEYFAIARVYQAVPKLHERSTTSRHRAMSRSAVDRISIWSAMKSYATSPVMLPSVALSCLYLTALSFAGQLITYLLSSPVSFSVMLLSIVRGFAACVELSATFVAPRLIDRIGSVRAGSWFLNCQLIFVSIAAGSLWSEHVLSVHGRTVVLVTAVILSRFGLWGFDLAAQQQIQDVVPESNRGTFSAIEAAMQNACEMTSFAITIIWAKPEAFKYPGGLSACAVLIAAVLYATFVRQRRGHLLHLEQGLCCSQYWRTHFAKNPSRDQADETLLSNENPED